HDPVHRSRAGDIKKNERASLRIVMYPAQRGNAGEPLLEPLPIFAIHAILAVGSIFPICAVVTILAVVSIFAICAVGTILPIGSIFAVSTVLAVGSVFPVLPIFSRLSGETWVALGPFCASAFSAETLNDLRQR